MDVRSFARDCSWISLAGALTACASGPAHHALPPGHPAVAADPCTGTSTTTSLGMWPSRWGVPSRIVDVKTRRELGVEALVEALSAARVVYLPESHPDRRHHAVQGGLLRRLAAREPHIALGVEMVQRPFQPALDEYAAQKLTEEELLGRLDWEERWGFDFELYRELFELARTRRLPLVALNAPREVTRAIAHGGLAALEPSLRAQLPKDLDLSSAAHRKFVRAAFEGHALTEAQFENFYAAQVAWDETMAETIVGRLAAPEGPRRVVVIVGSGHVRGGVGIPERVARRGVVEQKTVLPVTLAPDEPTLDEVLAEAPADFLWVLEPGRCGAKP